MFYAALDMALALADALLPLVQKEIKEGQISPEQQQKLRDRYNKLREAAAFEGPEWEVRPGEPT